jgi:hypothetical protein
LRDCGACDQAQRESNRRNSNGFHDAPPSIQSAWDIGRGRDAAHAIGCPAI